MAGAYLGGREELQELLCCASLQFKERFEIATLVVGSDRVRNRACNVVQSRKPRGGTWQVVLPITLIDCNVYSGVKVTGIRSLSRTNSLDALLAVEHLRPLISDVADLGMSTVNVYLV